MRKSLMVAAILLLVGCADQEAESKPDPDAPVTVELEGQEYTVYTYFDALMEYAEQAEEHPNQLDKYYKESVTDPFRKRAFEEEAGSAAILRDPSFKPPEDLEKLREGIHTLKEREDDIHKWIEQSLEKSVDKLPSNGTDIHIFPVDMGIAGFERFYQVIGGATGRAYNEDAFVLRLAPSIEKEALLNIVAHEYHHTVAFEKGYIEESNSLLHEVLIEGKAEMFARTVYPDVKSNISPPFSSKQLEEEIWTYLSENRSETLPRYKEPLMDGDRERSWPSESDYRIGRQIMKDFVENNPEVPIEDWTVMPAEEVLEKSRYEERFE
ncbi:DUF2268 domain-containing protein [Halobacillus salinus]|nr:DUF2268 domain-containing putative Zn-dependent protease [Halobacillus salinus]